MGNCVQQPVQRRTSLPSSSSSVDNLIRPLHRNLLTSRFRAFQPYNLNALIDETLAIIRTVVDNDQEPPHAMLVVSRIANREDRWLDVMIALIERVPISDPLGATVIALLLDECSLPSKELLQQLIKRTCAENRTRIKLLERIIDEYIQQMMPVETIESDDISTTKIDRNDDNHQDVNEASSIIDPTNDIDPEQHRTK
jgi:hypothetical protein